MSHTRSTASFSTSSKSFTHPVVIPEQGTWQEPSRYLLVGGDEEATRILAKTLSGVQPQPVLLWRSTSAEAFQLLNDMSFNCVLVLHSGGDLSARGVDALQFVRGVRGAGCQDAVLVLTTIASELLWITCCQNDAGIFACRNSLTSLALVSMIHRTSQQHQTVSESLRTTVVERQLQEKKQQECISALRSQQQFLEDCDEHSLGGLNELLPQAIESVYQEILRNFVMSNGTRFDSELDRLIEIFSVARLTPRQVFRFHLEQVERLMYDSGNIGNRHILDRAQTLGEQLLVLMCEWYAAQNAQTWWAWKRHPVLDAGISLERRAA